jgi:hypothetical protein
MMRHSVWPSLGEERAAVPITLVALCAAANLDLPPEVEDPLRLTKDRVTALAHCAQHSQVNPSSALADPNRGVSSYLR